MKLFVRVTTSQTWGKREGSCKIELAQFEVTIVVVISTAGLNAQARLADEETRSMDNPRWQVGWYVLPSYASCEFS